MDTPTGDTDPPVRVSIRLSRRVPEWARAEYARQERDAEAVRRRADPSSPTPDELDRERRDRYEAERANPMGTLARRVAAFKRETDPEYQRAQSREREKLLRRGAPEIAPEPAPTPSAPALLVQVWPSCAPRTRVVKGG